MSRAHVRSWTASTGEPEPALVVVELPQGPEKPEDPETVLGVEQGQASQAAWIGVTEVVEEQQAEQGEVDQAALSPSASVEQRGDPVGSREAPAQASPADAGADPIAQQHSESSGSQVPPALAGSEPAEAIQMVEDASRRPPPEVSRPEDAPQPIEPVQVARSQGDRLDSAAASADADKVAAATGLASEKEAPGSSIKRPAVWRPNGQVLAARGLEIVTRAPKFSITARLTQSPRDAMVQIKFGRGGAVKKAWFAVVDGEVRNTGSETIDASLMHAIYRWRAKGEVLETLSASDAEAGIVVSVRIIL